MSETTYPTPGRGHQFQMNIFGLLMDQDAITELQTHVWNRESFLPTTPAKPLTGQLSDLSDIAQNMAIELKDGSPGLVAKNKLRSSVRERLTEPHFVEVMNLLKTFKTAKPEQKKALAQTISDVAFWCQWLIRGYLFEGKQHWEVYCADMIPAPLSKIAFAANAALGRHQIEFVYDDYTLKAARLPADDVLAALNYDDPKAILDAIAAIDTPVGFNDVRGSMPEHNFRHNHSLMEWQMKAAFKGFDKVLAGDKSGWDAIVESARRANRVFKTMLVNTPSSSYPKIRLPIKGVRGAAGSVYHPHGVFYQDVGEDTYTVDGISYRGIYIDNEWGQTGANSSMFKYFDILIGVAQARDAFSLDVIMRNKMNQVFQGSVDSGVLGSNPIDSMQRAFDLFTRPPLHMHILVDTDKLSHEKNILTDDDADVLLQRLRLAYWVAEHRITHGKYVLKSIYQTEPIGGQSRAAGTGGSTPPFLKLFLDQTLKPARELLIKLLLRKDTLSAEQLREISDFNEKFNEFEEVMTAVRNKGRLLEHDEEVTNAH